MKYITFLFIAMLTFSSCTDFLDKEPDDMLTLERCSIIDRIRWNGFLQSIQVSRIRLSITIRKDL